jgi:transcriptional regulator NrdR family protein
MCPYCHGDKSKVTETRRNANSVWRRRRCLENHCGRGFISREFSTVNMKLPAEIVEASAKRLVEWKDRKERTDSPAEGITSTGALLAAAWGRNPVDQ